MTLKDFPQDFVVAVVVDSLITLLPAVSSMHTHWVTAQLCAKLVQHIGHLSHTCYCVPRAVTGQLSLNHISF